MKAEILEEWLKKSNYDPCEMVFLVQGFREGFDIQYKGPQTRRDEAKNIPFKVGNKTVMWNKIMKEVKEGRYAGPFNEAPYEFYIQSPLGLVPKGKDKVRLIFHLSFDFEEKSVHHHIPEQFCSVKYNDLDQAVKTTIEMDSFPIFYGKTDLSNAFRLIPLKVQCRRWLLMRAEDSRDGKQKFFVEKSLSFGASISCAIFQRFSDAIKHIYIYRTHKKGLEIWVINYLDDFLFIQVHKIFCDQGIREFLEMCELLGIKDALEKTEWGTVRIVFLGILLDGEKLILSIPEDKRRRAINMLEEIMSKRKSTVKNLQRLAGYLNFLNKAIYPGHTFTRRMYAKFTSKMKVLKPFHHITLDSEFKEDCRIWLNFLRNNELSVYRPMIDFTKEVRATELDFYTDASGNLSEGGFGCTFEDRWSFRQWNEKFMKSERPSIEYLELAALCIGVFMWWEDLRNRRIIIFCDNTAIVGMINNLTSGCKNCMFLLRKLTLKSLEGNFRIFAKYVRSADNGIADALSRRNWKRFNELTANKMMRKFPDSPPKELWPLEKIWLN